MAQDLEKRELSESEKQNIYNVAAGLVDATSYVIRFERKVNALNSAAEQFEQLGNYKDSQERGKKCRQDAQEAEKEGSKATFEVAKEKEKKARYKSDFVDAISEFERVNKMEAYEKEAKEHIEVCKQAIVRLENRAARKRKGIAAGILLVCVLIFTQTKAYPLAKGMIHQKLGHYQAALNNYKMAQGIPFASGRLCSGYYDIAQDYMKAGKEKKALKVFKKAKDYSDAEKKALTLEKKFIQEANTGDKVAFGHTYWDLAEKDGDKVLLVSRKTFANAVYGRRPETLWKKSPIYKWINVTFKTEQFSEEEQAILVEQCVGKETIGKATPEQVTILDSEQYEKYSGILKQVTKKWWLKDASHTAMGAKCVDTDGKVYDTYKNNTRCYVRPAVWVRIS